MYKYGARRTQVGGEIWGYQFLCDIKCLIFRESSGLYAVASCLKGEALFGFDKVRCDQVDGDIALSRQALFSGLRLDQVQVRHSTLCIQRHLVFFPVARFVARSYVAD